MLTRFLEGGFELVFGAVQVEKLDRQGRSLPIGMSFVDFVVYEESRTILIEVKDPSQRGATPKERQEFLRQIQQNTLVNDRLVPKGRDSYTYLHLMNQIRGRLLYIVILGMEEYDKSFDSALILGFQDRLRQRLNKETEVPWEIKYIDDVLVLTMETWNEVFPNYKLSRPETQPK